MGSVRHSSGSVRAPNFISLLRLRNLCHWTVVTQVTKVTQTTENSLLPNSGEMGFADK